MHCPFFMPLLMRKCIIALLLAACCIQCGAQNVTTKVLVVGGTTGGTAAGLQCARQGVQTVIVEQTPMLGGMLTAAAVSCTDGNHLLQSGIWQQFREALYKHYGKRDLESGWVSETCFEPHVADSIFKAWAAAEKDLQVLYGWYFDHILKTGNKVTGAIFTNTKGEALTVKATIVIDATELGDVFANAGAGYDLGMEDKAYTGEEEAPGKYDIIQDVTYSAILKDYGKGADKTIPRPAGYNEELYYCSTSDAPCNAKPYPMNTQQVLNYGRFTGFDTLHPKYMLNWPKNGNDYYLNAVELKPVDRAVTYTAAINKTLGFIYFLQTKLGFKNISLADDEVNNGLAYIPYNREGRRVKGAVRFTLNHIKKPYDYTLYRTGIAVGDYPVDHHHNAYTGKIPTIPFPKIPAFNIPLGALIPKGVEGLIVCEKGISVSNIANGCTRLQPVVLLTGQAAGIIAAQCITQSIQPAAISIRRVQGELLNNKCYLMPFCDVPPTDSAWAAIQRVAATGLLHGFGKSEGWENKMYFYPESTISYTELAESAKAYIKQTGKTLKSGAEINFTDVINFMESTGIANASQVALARVFIQQHLRVKNYKQPITRKQLAQLLDVCNVFNRSVNLDGGFVEK